MTRREGKVSDTGKTANQEDLESVLDAIRTLVRKEARSRIDGRLLEMPVFEPERVLGITPDTRDGDTPPDAPPRRKIFVLQPHMRVHDAGDRDGDDAGADDAGADVLPDSEEIPHAPPLTSDESFAIANPLVDEQVLREMVREVVQEQLRGDIGREIIRAMKMDLIRSLEKY